MTKIYQCIIENRGGQIERLERRGKDEDSVREKLVKERWDQPYTLLGIFDITLERAIEKAERILKKQRKQRKRRRQRK